MYQATPPMATTTSTTQQIIPRSFTLSMSTSGPTPKVTKDNQRSASQVIKKLCDGPGIAFAEIFDFSMEIIDDFPFKGMGCIKATIELPNKKKRGTKWRSKITYAVVKFAVKSPLD